MQVEKELVALNVGICEVMLHLIVPPNLESDDKEHHATHQTLEYFESALHGMVPIVLRFSLPGTNAFEVVDNVFSICTI